MNDDVNKHHHKCPMVWGVPDFVGKYHLSRMATGTPIPGTAIRVEQERQAFMEQRKSSLRKVMDDIEARRALRVTSRTRKAAITARVEVQAAIGLRIDAVQRMYQNTTSAKKARLSTARYVPDEDFHVFLGYVEANNIYQVKSKLRVREKAFRLVATAEEKHGNTPMHRAVSLGFVEMSGLLLEAGANLDVVNLMGDAPIHCCWRFWRSDASKYFVWRKNPYLMTTSQQLEDFATMGRDVKTTVELLHLLTRGGADVDLKKNNGEVALHTAARQGPLEALWVLLFGKARHDIVDHRSFTPEYAATRAGNGEFVALLANWPIARVKYMDSEFVQEWMHFLCDPDTNLGNNLTASEVMAHIRMEEHEGSTAVRARGGHTLIDEMVTGPVVSSEERANAKMAEFSAETVSLTSTTESDRTVLKRPTSDESGPTAGHTRIGVAEIGVGVGGKEATHDGTMSGKTKTKSKLGMGKEIDVFLAQARDENGAASLTALAGGVEGGATGQGTAYSRLVAKENLEGRKSRWPGGRNNGKAIVVASAVGGGGGRGGMETSGADPFGRPMTTTQRRRVAALEVAEDGAVEGPSLRPATSSVLLTTRSRATKKATAPHPFYGRRLLTQRVLDQREREAKIKPTATIFVDDRDTTGCAADAAGKLGRKEMYLTENRTAFNDTKMLPGRKDPSMCIEGLGHLHALHPIMQRRKLYERPFCELQGHRKHNENVYCSTLETYSPTAWNTIATHEPLLPIRRQGPL